MSSADPWLSVVIPTYNGETHLSAALASIAREDHEGVECVVVDDGSTDATLDIAGRFARELDLTILEPGRTGNWVRGTNVGLARARAPYACFLHQDDVWMPGRSETVRALIGRYASARLWTHAARFIDPAGRPVGLWRLPFRADGIVASDEFVGQLLIQNFLCIAAPVFRVRDAVESGGLDETLWYTADWDLWLRLGSMGAVACTDSPGVGFRVHAESQTAMRTRDSSDMRSQLETVLLRHLGAWSCNHTTLERERTERVARASIDLNVALAAARHGDRRSLTVVSRAFRHLGLAGVIALARASRLHERVGARLRVEGRNRLHRVTAHLGRTDR